MKTMETILGLINPAARPALTIAGTFFLLINVLAGAYLVRHWRRLFGRDPRVDGDREAVRGLQVIVITIPLLLLTIRLALELVGLWIN